MPTGVDVAELMGGVTFGESIEYTPIGFGLPSVPCPEWWVQPVYFISGLLLSRKDVILAAANKDGGAHVDAPDVKLDALNEGFWLKTESGEDGGTVSTPVVRNHFRMLRRFADELLHSPDLLALSRQNL